jgi:hypothetical protein
MEHGPSRPAALLTNIESAELELERLPAPVGGLKDILFDIRRDNPERLAPVSLISLQLALAPLVVFAIGT